jgi:hypothetical protein
MYDIYVMSCTMDSYDDHNNIRISLVCVMCVYVMCVYVM